jgi:signal recognition particle receptor subunit beta
MPILVLANKQDLKEAISAEQLWGELGLESETRRR